jgi:hypothetical protein
MITNTIRTMLNNAFNDEKIPSLAELVQAEQKENVLNIIAYVGEGNVKLQQKRLMLDKDIENLRNSVLNYSFIENKNL